MALKGRWVAGRLQLFDGDYSAIGGKGVDFGNVNSGALLHGGGTATYPLVNSTSDAKFMSYYLKSSATSGTSRGMYLKLFLTANAGGEAIRAFTQVESNTPADTVNGAHLSLGFGASAGTVTGLGTGARMTLHIPDRAITAGTLAGGQSEVYMDGTSSSPTATTLALHRFIVDGGDATAQNKLTHVLDFVNLGSAVFANQSSWSVSKVLKIKVNGTNYYLPLSTAA